MFDFLDHFGLPIKYATIGFFGGLLGILIAHLIGFQLEKPWAGVVGVSLGGLIGGYVRQRRGKAR